MVRCKFKCTKKEVDSEGMAHIKLEPVSCGSKENEEFYKYTPNGQFEVWCVNPEASKQIEEGKEYYIDISEALQAASADEAKPCCTSSDAQTVAATNIAANISIDKMQNAVMAQILSRLQDLELKVEQLSKKVEG